MIGQLPMYYSIAGILKTTDTLTATFTPIYSEITLQQQPIIEFPGFLCSFLCSTRGIL